jgi:hypothetical protein
MDPETGRHRRRCCARQSRDSRAAAAAATRAMASSARRSGLASSVTFLNQALGNPAAAHCRCLGTTVSTHRQTNSLPARPLPASICRQKLKLRSERLQRTRAYTDLHVRSSSHTPFFLASTARAICDQAAWSSSTSSASSAGMPAASSPAALACLTRICRQVARSDRRLAPRASRRSAEHRLLLAASLTNPAERRSSPIGTMPCKVCPKASSFLPRNVLEAAREAAADWQESSDARGATRTMQHDQPRDRTGCARFAAATQS